MDVNAAPSAAGFRPLHRRLLRNRVPVLLPRQLHSIHPHPSRPTPHLLGRRHQEVEFPFPYVREGETGRGAKELPLAAGSCQTARVAQSQGRRMLTRNQIARTGFCEAELCPRRCFEPREHCLRTVE